MAKGVWIVAEQRDGALRKVSFELASTARKLADQLGEEVGAVLCGSGVEAMAAELVHLPLKLRVEPTANVARYDDLRQSVVPSAVSGVQP